MSARDDLERAVGAAPPPAIAALGERDLARLCGLFTAAHDRERAAMVKAVDDGLGFVPRILRGAVKKVLF